MVPALLIAMVLTFTYMMWRRYQDYNVRQLQICEHTLKKLLSYANQAGESRENLTILLNAAIETYNETVRGPWFYRNRWKIPRHEYEVKKNETQRHSERGHSDSESDISEGQE